MSLYKTLKADQIQARKDRDVLKAALLTTLMGEIQVSATGNGTPDYDEELKVAIGLILADCQLEGGKRMGFVMGQLKQQYPDQFDASKVKGIIG